MDKRLASLLSKTYFGKDVSSEYRAIVATDPAFLDEVKAELGRQPELIDGRCHATKKQIEGLRTLISYGAKS